MTVTSNCARNASVLVNEKAQLKPEGPPPRISTRFFAGIPEDHEDFAVTFQDSVLHLNCAASRPRWPLFVDSEFSSVHPMFRLGP